MHYIVIAIIALCLVSFGLDFFIIDALDGLLYNLLVLISVVLVGLSILAAPKYKAFKKKQNREIIEKDGEELALLVKSIQDFDFDEAEKVPEEPLYLNLEEQYKYIQKVELGMSHELSQKTQSLYGKQYMSFKEMEFQIEENLKSVKYGPSSFLEAVQSQVPHEKGKKYYPMMKLKTFNEIFEVEFLRTFGMDSNYNGFHNLVSNLEKRFEEVKKEKGQVVWSIKQGVEGEQRIVDNMKLMVTDGHILESVRIEYDGRSAESDVIYVGSTGIHSLEIKNFGAKGNWSIQISRDGQWRKVFPDGNKEPMTDVGNQMNYHVAVKERFLNEKLREMYGESTPKVKVKTAVVIANDKVMVDNESDLPVLRQSSLNRYLENDEPILSEEWQRRIASILEEYKKPGKPYEIPNLHAKMENLLLESTQLAALYELRSEWKEKMSNDILGRTNEDYEDEGPLPSRKERRGA